MRGTHRRARWRPMNAPQLDAHPKLNADPNNPDSWPESVQHRPRDARRGLPIPKSAVAPGDGPEEERFSFTMVSAEQVVHLIANRLCGVCGEAMGYWVAFIGGPQSTASMAYVDPPMHPDCARAALTLCPHMALKRHKRAPDHRLPHDVTTAPGFVDDKPETLHIGITRSYTAQVYQGSLVITPAPFKTIEDYGYNEQGRIVPLDTRRSRKPVRPQSND